MGTRLKKFSLATYKLHALGDYSTMVCAFGKTDSYSTQTVSNFDYLNPGRTCSEHMLTILIIIGRVRASPRQAVLCLYKQVELYTTNYKAAYARRADTKGQETS